MLNCWACTRVKFKFEKITCKCATEYNKSISQYRFMEVKHPPQDQHPPAALFLCVPRSSWISSDGSPAPPSGPERTLTRPTHLGSSSEREWFRGGDVDCLPPQFPKTIFATPLFLHLFWLFSSSKSVTSPKRGGGGRGEVGVVWVPHGLFVPFFLLKMPLIFSRLFLFGTLGPFRVLRRNMFLYQLYLL